MDIVADIWCCTPGLIFWGADFRDPAVLSLIQNRDRARCKWRTFFGWGAASEPTRAVREREDQCHKCGVLLAGTRRIRPYTHYVQSYTPQMKEMEAPMWQYFHLQQTPRKHTLVYNFSLFQPLTPLPLTLRFFAALPSTPLTHVPFYPPTHCPHVPTSQSFLSILTLSLLLLFSPTTRHTTRSLPHLH